jgi:hypothetical protein
MTALPDFKGPLKPVPREWLPETAKATLKGLAKPGCHQCRGFGILESGYICPCTERRAKRDHRRS